MYNVAVRRQSTISGLRTIFSKSFSTGYGENVACARFRAHWTGWRFRGRPIRCGARTWIRGAKSRAKLKLGDLPQGALASEAHTEDQKDDPPAYPTVVQQAKNNMRKFDNCVLLTRVGGFYEVRHFFRNALTDIYTVVALLRTCRALRTIAQSQSGKEEDHSGPRANGTPFPMCMACNLY